MRITATLDALFPTIRAGVLSAILLQPERWWFMTELARQLSVTPSSLQRELETLVGSELLLRRQDGRRIYYNANTESPVFTEMKGLIEKTAGKMAIACAGYVAPEDAGRKNRRAWHVYIYTDDAPLRAIETP